MRPSRVAAATAGAVAAMAVTWLVLDDEPASCQRTLNFHHSAYTPWETSEEVPSAGVLGSGVERGCGQDGAFRRPTQTSRTTGVDPGLALATPAEANTLWLAAGATPADLPDEVAAILVQRRP